MQLPGRTRAVSGPKVSSPRLQFQRVANMKQQIEHVPNTGWLYTHIFFKFQVQKQTETGSQQQAGYSANGWGHASVWLGFHLKFFRDRSNMFSPKRVGDAGATVIILYVKIRAMINNMGIRSDLYANNFNVIQDHSQKT